jgi:O-antigen/teichoic acid export membrane protein
MSVKKNYLYNLMRVINRVLFPMLTIPYISRVLGAEGIGTVEYFIAIASYGILVSEFGLSQYASIEIAKLKNNPTKLKEKVISTFNFQLLVTILGGLVFLIISLLLELTDQVYILVLVLNIMQTLYTLK